MPVNKLKLRIMEVIQELMNQPESKSNYDYRMFKAVKAGKYLLSIQGSCGHYCSPRATIGPNLYSTMELAILRNRSMVSINRSQIFKKFKRYNELLKSGSCLNSGSAVYGYVPIDLLNDLYLFLKNDK